MKSILLLLVVCFWMSPTFAQEQNDDDFKYQSLLWEISGNGLEKTSYLYGTMHVSRKIAFNLDDIFFESLNKADMVAVESMPDKWVDYLFEDGQIGYGGSFAGGGYGGYGYAERSFYSQAFQMNFPDKMDIVKSMFGQYQLINGLLYRSEGAVDFEEDTYLDMFIYQTGKRFKKPAFSLEGHQESRDLVEKAYKDARKTEIDEWLKELVEKKGNRYFDIIQDAYRDRNIGLLDSVNRAIYTDTYMKYMLFARNENMVDSMETLMKSGSLFTGVGAAHLPGENGMIDMLRKRGYTLKPLLSEQTDKGKAIKKKFEGQFIEKEYTPKTTEDGFLTLNTTHKLYEIYSDGGSIAISPDYDNGAYITIARLYTYNLLRHPSEQLNESDLEKLLFEFIPGEILSKKIISKPYPGFDIENITKTGNHQRYLFYVTPLEIIILKMDGKKEFVKNESDKVISSIRFSPNKNSSQEVCSAFKGFDVEMAGYTIINNTKYKGKRFVQAYDEASGNFAFLTERNLNDVYYIEEDSFELHYIMEQFCENVDTKLDENGHYEVKDNVPAFYSYTILDSAKNKKLHLNTRLFGERFYLIGFMGDEDDAKDFFDKVAIHSFHRYPQTFEEQRDTNYYYTVIAPERNKFNNGRPSFEGQMYGQEEKKDYEGFSKNQVYTINSNEQVAIRVTKFHDWKQYENIDSLWAKEQKVIKKLKYKLVNTSTSQEDSLYFFEGMAVRDHSLRGVKFKYILKNGTLYLLRALVHQDATLSPFIDTFFQTFTPLDTAIGISPLSNKSDLFFEAIESQDSILLGSGDYLYFETKHFDKVKQLFLEKEYEEDWKFLKSELLNQICHMEYDKTALFLEKLYLDSYENSYYQMRILRALIAQKSKAANTKVLALLAEDIPISDGGGDFLWRLKDSMQLAYAMFPALLDYANIPDYKYDIQGIMGYLVTHGDLSPKKYRKFKKQLLTEGKIELKRAVGKKEQTKAKERYYRNYNSTSGLNRYVNLLYPFRKDKKVAEFLTKVSQLEDTDILSNLIELQLIYKEPVDKATIQKMAEDDKKRFSIYSILRRYDALNLIPDSLRSEVALAKGLLDKGYYYGETIDTIYYLHTEEISISRKTQSVHFFIKKSKKMDYDYNYGSKREMKDKTTIIALSWDPKDKIFATNFYDIEQEVTNDETQEDVLKELRKRIQLRDRKRLDNNNRSYSSSTVVW